MPAATISSPAPPSSGRSSSSSSDIACDLASVCVDVIKLFAPDIHQADDTVKFHQVDEKRARGTELSSCSRRFKRKVLTILYCKFSYLFFLQLRGICSGRVSACLSFTSWCSIETAERSLRSIMQTKPHNSILSILIQKMLPLSTFFVAFIFVMCGDRDFKFSKS